MGTAPAHHVDRIGWRGNRLDDPARTTGEVKVPRLWIMSDLRLETLSDPEAFWLDAPEFDVLVVAGNVWEGDIVHAFKFIKRLAGGKPTVFVPGNREYWRQAIPHENQRAQEAAPDYGVTLLNMSANRLAGVQFAGGTLWTDGRCAPNPLVPKEPIAEPIKGLGRQPRAVTNADLTSLHDYTLNVIETAARPCKNTLPVVVVTHYAPHPLCIPREQRSSWKVGTSVSDLSSLLDTGLITLWVHGHEAYSVDLTRPSGTRIICNPAGPGFSNPAFREDWVIEV